MLDNSLCWKYKIVALIAQVALITRLKFKMHLNLGLQSLLHAFLVQIRRGLMHHANSRPSQRRLIVHTKSIREDSIVMKIIKMPLRLGVSRATTGGLAGGFSHANIQR